MLLYIWLSSCTTTGAQAVKFMCPEMMQLPERPPHPSLSPSLNKKIKNQGDIPIQSCNNCPFMRQCLNLGLLKLPKYEVTEAAANRVFTERIHRRVAPLTQSVMLICCAPLKASPKSQGAENLRVYLSLTKKKKAKNLWCLRSRTTLLADRKTTIRSWKHTG